MRFKSPSIGDTKTTRKFLWLPQTLPDGINSLSFRWLERATIRWEYICFDGVHCGWCPVSFEDNP